MTVNFHIPLAAEQQAVAVELQDMLVDLIDLSLIGKHVHWNVEGRLFRSVHHELDDLVDAWRILSDDVAERAVTIGASPDGQVEAIAGATRLDPVPPGHLSDRQVLKAIGDRIADGGTPHAASASTALPSPIRSRATCWCGPRPRWKSSCGWSAPSFEASNEPPTTTFMIPTDDLKGAEPS